MGASWLTKEKTVMETANVLNYLDAVLEKEQLPQHLNFIVFGYSQGVSVATRWVAKRKLRCDRLILHSGGLPRELKAEDFSFLSENGTKVTAIVGDNDEYIDAEILKSEAQRMETLFDGQAEQIIFEGKHEVKKELLIQFAE